MIDQHYERENPEFWNKTEKDITKDQLLDARKQIEQLENKLNIAIQALNCVSNMDITENYYSVDEQPCIIAINALEELGGL